MERHQQTKRQTNIKIQRQADGQRGKQKIIRPTGQNDSTWIETLIDEQRDRLRREAIRRRQNRHINRKTDRKIERQKYCRTERHTNIKTYKED